MIISKMKSRRSIKPRRSTRQVCHGKRADSSSAKMMTMMPRTRSKPIPIPLREADPNVHDEIDMAKETKLYDAATWRMYELISAARLRRAAVNYYQSGDSQRHMLMLTRDDSAPAISPQKLQRHRRAYSLPERPSTPSPSSSLVDEVFVMDSL